MKDDVPSKEDAPARIVCALLAMFVPFSIQRFLLGDTKGAVIRILLCCVPISFIEGIIYLTKTDEEFYQTYVVEKKAWF
jgi:hypothetical protein